MKAIAYLLGGLLVSGSLAVAATNDLSATLQQGLFEEEANHDLNAAVRAYEVVVSQFDKDRKLAATAVFRLGECYRKQGRTNEANVQYQRILREFGDQTELAKLSRNYVGDGAPATAPSVEAMLQQDAARAASLTEDLEVRRLQSLLKESPDLINAVDPKSGYTLLQQAASAGQLDVVKFLLANGADINARNPNQKERTALHIAAAAGHKAMVELLLDKGANINAADSDSRTPLHDAVQNGFRNLVETLVSRGADVNAKARNGVTPLYTAAANGFTSIGEFLLAHRADVNAVGTLGPPLNVASRGDLPFVTLLLEHKADVNVDVGGGQTPLHSAVKAKQVAVASLLIAHGAKVNVRDKSFPDRGWTPLVIAVDQDDKPMVTMLLTNGADPNVKFDVHNNQYNPTEVQRGLTPLLLAASKHEGDLFEPLLVAKADPNLRSDNGTAVIHWTLNPQDPSESKRLISLLLDHGADVEARDKDTQTPLMQAVWTGDKGTIELLLAHKADPNAHTKNGITALHILAVLCGSSPVAKPDVPAIARLLLDNGAEVNALDNRGETPLRKLRLPTALAAPGTSAAIADELAAVLREHGGVTDLPLPDRIQVRRPGTDYSQYIFGKGTIDWNQFTLLELIAVQYDLLSGDPERKTGDSYDVVLWVTRLQGLGFPDFSRIRLVQRNHEQHVDLTPLIEAGDCSNDQPLDWGEVVEIPESDHPLNRHWPGFTTQEFLNLKKCLTRTVQVVVKGKSNKLTLAPDITVRAVPVFDTSPYGSKEVVSAIHTGVPYWVKNVLLGSGLVLTSSDLSRVKVTRREASTGQTHEWVLDCSQGKPAPDLWLRNGDVIEVPEKP